MAVDPDLLQMSLEYILNQRKRFESRSRASGAAECLVVGISGCQGVSTRIEGCSPPGHD